MKMHRHFTVTYRLRGTKKFVTDLFCLAVPFSWWGNRKEIEMIWNEEYGLIYELEQVHVRI